MKEKIKYIGSIAFFSAFMIGCFAPLEMYLSNMDYFWFSIWDLIPFSIIIFLFVFAMQAIIFVVLVQINLKLMKLLEGILIGGLLAFYIQGNFVITSYGTLNGDMIDWSQYKVSGLISVLLWIVIIILCSGLYMKMEEAKIRKIFAYIALGVSGVQINTLSTLMITKTPFRAEKQYIATDLYEYSYSDEENFTILVLDHCDSQILQNVLSEDEKYAEWLSDFTFYANTSGMFSSTDLAIPQIISGISYKNDKTYGEYLTQVYTTSPLLQSLQKNDWDIGIYTDITLPHEKNDDMTIDSINNWSYNIAGVSSHRSLEKYMYKLVCFRYFPQPLKKYFWFYPDEMEANLKYVSDEYDTVSWDNELFYQNIKTIDVDSPKPSFHFIHLEGTHTPYTLNEDMEIEENGTSIEEETRGILLLVDSFLDKLRELNIYDNHRIMIMADHGALDKNQAPILLVKGINEHHKLQVSDVPISYEYLQSGYQRLLAGDSGNQIFDYDLQNNDTLRKYYYYRFKFHLGVDNYATDIVEYEVDGNITDEKSMHETGKIYVGTEK